MIYQPLGKISFENSLLISNILIINIIGTDCIATYTQSNTFINVCVHAHTHSKNTNFIRQL